MRVLQRCLPYQVSITNVAYFSSLVAFTSPGKQSSSFSWPFDSGCSCAFESSPPYHQISPDQIARFHVAAPGRIEVSSLDLRSTVVQVRGQKGLVSDPKDRVWRTRSGRSQESREEHIPEALEADPIGKEVLPSKEAQIITALTTLANQVSPHLFICLNSLLGQRTDFFLLGYHLSPCVINI